MASVGNIGNGTNEMGTAESNATKGQETGETAKTNDAENQIAAVLTEMQNASENIGEGEKRAESSQDNFEPSIAVIMQDDSSGTAEQPSNSASGGQVNLTQDQIEVMQSGQIPSQASLYSLGNIVLILSPDVMATGGLTPEQIQQIQESQATALAENAQEASAININLGSAQKEGESTSASGETLTAPAAPETAEATSTTVAKDAKGDKSDKKKDEGNKEKSETAKVSSAGNKEADQAAPKTPAGKDKTDSTKSTLEKDAAAKESQPAEKGKTSPALPVKKRYREGQKKNDEESKTADEGESEEKEGEKNDEENKEKNKEGEEKADGDKEGEKKTIKCPNCTESFSTKEEFEEHSKTHNRRKRGRQPLKHTPDSSPETSKPSKPSRPKRAKKTGTEEGKEDVSIQCEVCGESFAAENKLRKHLTTHNVNKRLHCDGCKVPFAFQYQLDRHTRRNTGEEPYSCDHCSETFKLRCHFNYHLRLHNPKKIHQCEHCDKTFNTFANLKGHTRIHTGEKPYKCEFCQKAFTEYSSLAKHRRAHTGERPFKCNECEKSFSQSGGLKVHMRVHTGEKPYKCVFCERSFAKGYNLKTHMRTHTGEKPYKCDNCSKTFSQHSTLVQHIRRHEGKAPKAKTTTAQQTTGNPETDIVESHQETPTTSVMEVQVIQQSEAPQAGVQEQAAMETQGQTEDVTRTIETSALVALQHTAPPQPNEVVINEKTQAEEVAALQEATQAIQMLQMQQLVHQVEEVVSQTAFS